MLWEEGKAEGNQMWEMAVITLVAFLRLLGAHGDDDGFPRPTYLHESEQRKERETSFQVGRDTHGIKVKGFCADMSRKARS